MEVINMARGKRVGYDEIMSEDVKEETKEIMSEDVKEEMKENIERTVRQVVRIIKQFTK